MDNNHECDASVASYYQGMYMGHFQCEKPVRFKVTYYDSILKRTVTSYKCGIHKVAIEKNAKRLQKLGIDSKLVIESIEPEHENKPINR